MLGEWKMIKNVRARLPWLGALLILGLAVSAVSGYFEGVVDELPMLVAFQPLVLGMSGNAGTQSLALTVRILVKNEKMSRRECRAVIAKETRVALLAGIVIGFASFLIIGSYLAVLGKYPIGIAMTAAGCVGAAMTVSMMISGSRRSLGPPNHNSQRPLRGYKLLYACVGVAAQYIKAQTLSVLFII